MHLYAMEKGGIFLVFINITLALITQMIKMLFIYLKSFYLNGLGIEVGYMQVLFS